MNRFFCTLIVTLIFSFSFSQGLQKDLLQKKVKENTVLVVNYLEKGLKLNDKQKAICMKAFAEYGHFVQKAQLKAQDKRKAQKESADPKSKNVDHKRALNSYVMRFAQKRDQVIVESLKPKQVKKYNELMKAVHPVTLELKEKRTR